MLVPRQDEEATTASIQGLYNLFLRETPRNFREEPAPCSTGAID
jgi:hypothetical protein